MLGKSLAGDLLTKVMASGVFDIIHAGHISYLEQAKALGDFLVVVVACDETVRNKKHEPITPEAMRLRIINSIKPVDLAILGKNSGNIYDTISEVKPDIIVLGFDQSFDEKCLEKNLIERGYNIQVKRASELAEDLNATRRIIDKIKKETD